MGAVGQLPTLGHSALNSSYMRIADLKVSNEDFSDPKPSLTCEAT